VTEPRGDELERSVARLLGAGTYASIALLAAGVVAMAAAGRSPLDAAPGFDAARILPDLAALKPEGFVWLGIVLVVATPSARVATSLVGYMRRHDRSMAVVSILILGVIALSVAAAIAVGSEA
jgi:uncharacterized membrane protein